MNDPVSSFLLDFNRVVEECSVFTFITRDGELQKQTCQKLEGKFAEIAAEKERAISEGNEEYANILLGCESLTAAMIAEITMWVLLKEGSPDKAWDKLIDAQGHLADAIRAHKGFAACEDRLQRLQAVEHLVFPPQLFLSSGMIVKSQICSICGGEYEDCEHVKQRPYMGKLCTVGLIPSKVDHVSIVTNPANRHCRIVSFSAEGGNRSRMTWLIHPAEEHPADKGGGDSAMTFEGIISSLSAEQSDSKGEFIDEPALPPDGTPLY